jgi:alpha-glucosidase (family GH31 glycosyl hydrolase)
MYVYFFFQDTTKLDTYFPSCTWYDYYTGQKIRGNGTRMGMAAPMDRINLYVREGSILPMKAAAMTTTER